MCKELGIVEIEGRTVPSEQDIRQQKKKKTAASTDHRNVREIVHRRMNLSIFYLKKNANLQNPGLFIVSFLTKVIILLTLFLLSTC